MELSNYFNSFVTWLKEFWASIDIKGWAEGIGGSSSEAVEAAIYFGSGFAIGFLFKKYFKFLLTTILIAIILIKIFEYNNVLVIDWEGVNTLFGFESTTDFSTIVNNAFAWIKANMIIFISSIVGFLVGYKLG